jgi:two-component system NtrC family sensor kinase
LVASHYSAATILLNKILNAQESDTTGDDTCTKACNIIFLSVSIAFVNFLNELRGFMKLIISIEHKFLKIFIPLLFLCNFVALGQNAQLDSLNKLIAKAATDTAKINLTNKKIALLSRINIDTAINVSQQNIEEAKKINYKKGEADALLQLATNFCNKGKFDEAQRALETSQDLFKQLKDSTGFAKLYSGYGMMYGMQSKYESAIFYFQKVIDAAQRTNDKSLLSTAYHNISISYYMQSNYSQALMYQQKALQFAEELHDVPLQAKVEMNMGLAYSSLNYNVRAEQSFLKAIGLAQKQGLKNVELYAYSNLSTLYYDAEKKFELAYDYAIKAATLAEQMGDQGMQATSLSNAARALAAQKKFQQAEELGRKSMIIADSSSEPLNIYQTYSAMGSILTSEEKYKDAIPFFEKSFAALKDADIYNEQNAESYADLSKCYEKTGNYSKALSAYKMSARITDSIRSKDNIRNSTELTLNYEFEKKQQAAKAEQEKKDAVASAKQIALIIGLALTFILALVALNAYRNKRKANALLSTQKEEIQTTLTELKTTQAQLVQAEKMASLGELTAGIAHEIQNPLNFVNNFSEVSQELVDEMETELTKGNTENAIEIGKDVKQNLQKIVHHGQRADAIVKSMLLHSRTSSAQKEPVDINALADEYLRLSYHGLRAKDKTFNAMVQTDFDKSIGKINLIQQDIGRVLLNLFTNAFYSVTQKKQLNETYQPIVSVCTKKLKDKVEIRVKDNGTGIPQKVLDKVFQPFFTTKPAGQGTGLGLSLSYDIIRAHKGEIKLNTEEGEGAEFIIHLPT